MLGQRYLGLLGALATTLALTWGLGRPALWLDEAASAIAVQRSWDDLWTLSEGPEAPLLPYYVLLKLFCGAVRVVHPALLDHPEILFRLPSALVTVLAGWILAAWASRYAPARVVVATGALLLLTTGFTRFGQEARPYAAVLLLAVLATVLWSALAHDLRFRWIPAYALCIAAMIAMHTLSAGLVAAHLLAALVCRPGRRRWPIVWRTGLAGALGLAIASPLILLTAGNGTGPITVYPDITPRYTLAVFVRLFTTEPEPLLFVGPVFLLAVVGLTQLSPGPTVFIARLAACWALIPLVAMAPVLVIHPNLLVARYALFVVPAWALLAGLGVAALGDLVRPARRPGLGTALASAVTLALIAGAAVAEAPSHLAIRKPAGHGEDIRPALELAMRPEYAKLKIAVSSRNASVAVGVYAKKQEKRLALQRIQRDQPYIWPIPLTGEEAKKILRKQDRLILLQRIQSDPGCRQEQNPVPVAEIERCRPSFLGKIGFRVQKVEPAAPGWAFAVLERST